MITADEARAKVNAKRFAESKIREEKLRQIEAQLLEQAKVSRESRLAAVLKKVEMAVDNGDDSILLSPINNSYEVDFLRSDLFKLGFKMSDYKFRCADDVDYETGYQVYW